MASMEAVKGNDETRVMPVCPICFEPGDTLKVVGICKHAFCRKCLSNHLRVGLESLECFRCPTCQVQCKLPGDGVEGLLDHDHQAEPVEMKVDENLQVMAPVQCRLCFYQNKTSPAANFCLECNDLYLCHGCTEVHNKSIASQDHLVTSVVSLGKRDDFMCALHSELLKSYCQVCSKRVCHICILLHHSDHGIVKAEEQFRCVVDSVRTAVERQEARLKELASFQCELSHLKSAALEKQDCLIQAVEDHAETCVKGILEHKADLKKQIKSQFEVLDVIVSNLEKIPDTVSKLQESVRKTRKTISGSVLSHSDLDSLTRVMDETEAACQLADEIDGEAHIKPFQKLFNDIPVFQPKFRDMNFGTLETLGKSSELGKEFHPKMIDMKQIRVDNDRKYIPGVAILGNIFAVAHPVLPGEHANAIDLYEFPCTWREVLTEQVNPVYGMSATPDGKLAVLSDGLSPQCYSVRLIDVKTGNTRAAGDFPLLHLTPLSFTVSVRNKYFILCRESNCGKRSVHVVGEDGMIEQKIMITVTKVLNIDTISVGWMSMAVMGQGALVVYKLTNGVPKLAHTSAGILPFTKTLDIATTTIDELYVCAYNGKEMYLRRVNVSDEDPFGNSEFALLEVEGDRPSRISVMGDYIVITHGHTIRVYNK